MKIESKLIDIDRPDKGSWYVYSMNKGQIALIREIINPLSKKIVWKLKCIKGNIFKDVLIFDDKDGAIGKIKELLEK